MILSKHELDGKRYYFASSISEEVKFVFLEQVGNNSMTYVNDGDIIARLLQEVIIKVQKLEGKK